VTFKAGIPGPRTGLTDSDRVSPTWANTYGVDVTDVEVAEEGAKGTGIEVDDACAARMVGDEAQLATRTAINAAVPNQLNRLIATSTTILSFAHSDRPDVSSLPGVGRSTAPARRTTVEPSALSGFDQSVRQATVRYSDSQLCQPSWGGQKRPMAVITAGPHTDEVSHRRTRSLRDALTGTVLERNQHGYDPFFGTPSTRVRSEMASAFDSVGVDRGPGRGRSGDGWHINIQLSLLEAQIRCDP
jgi:hypothetical protein